MGPHIPFITFRVGDTWYGSRLETVKEIIPIQEITPLPSDLAYVAGLTTLRGAVICVIDLKQLLTGQPTQAGKVSHMVIRHSGTEPVAILAEEVDNVISIPGASLEPPIETLTEIQKRYIDHTVRQGDRVIATLGEKIP